VPADAIVEQAKKSKLDLLAMGSIGFGASRHTPMGSVATRVASRCRTALLLVREK
jgi:nucleotide-binding universal stress UspA family protein